MKNYIFLFLLLLPAISSAQNRHIKPLRFDEASLDISRTVINADRVQRGVNLPQAFTGEGVVLGVSDIGFDFTHPTFQNSNIVAFWDMLSRDTLNQYSNVLDNYPLLTGRDYTADEIRPLMHSYDGIEQMHGTHVLGIAAGGDSYYQGFAPDADIVLVNNVLSNNRMQVDALQLSKLEGNYKIDEFRYIFDYAERVGKPCVINMSAGSRQSFGDDFDIYNKQISDLCGPGRIIVASAGNSGTRGITLHKRRDQQSVGSRVYSSYAGFYLFLQKEGDVDCNLFYSNDEGVTKQPLPDSLYESIDTISDYDGMPVRYYIFMNEKLQKAGCDWLYTTLTGTGEAYLFTQDAQYINSKKNDGFNDATDDYSVNFPGCYDDVICVSASDHRNEVVDFEGKLHVEDNGDIGHNYKFTSVGPRLDGYQKPDVSAPGSVIASSMNSFFAETHHGDDYWYTDKEHFTHDGRTYAWTVCSGTSSASPMVAGIIALWLQANPNLTPQDIKDIIRRTSTHPDPSLSYPNAIYGYGEIDAYAGLLDALSLSGVEAISKTQPEGVRFTVNGGTLSLHFSETGADAEVLVFSTNGTLIHRESLFSVASTETISLNNLPKGVYAIQINSASKSLKGSTLIRL